MTMETMRRSRGGKIWLQLGSGPNAHPTFVNIDGNIFQKKDIWIDLRFGLPFPTEAVDGIYSCHTFEHFYWRELSKILRECFRVLRPHGYIRILVPSVELAVETYFQNDVQWFPDFPDKFDSLGGRFSNFLFCDGQHRLAFDFSFMVEALERVRFSQVLQMKPRESNFYPVEILRKLEPETGYIESSLVVEARKPGS
jgi:prepilin-type processing-associated H-X9-DG protein